MTKVKNFFKNVKTKAKNLKIYDNRKLFFVVPLIVVLIALICGTCYHFNNSQYDKFANIGVDFQGGTLLTVEFSKTGMNSGDNYDANVEMVREVLDNNGLKIASVQSSGDSSIIFRYLNSAVKVNGEFQDYSTDDKVSEMNALNEKIRSDVEAATKAKYDGVITAKTTTTLIGNSASVRLLRTALISVAIALALMLVYIIIRFDFYSALAAIIALLHDIIIMMSFTVIFYVEIGSTLIAAIITIVAYSINNTIVVFDRIRSIIKPYKNTSKTYDVGEVIDTSVHGTFTRTCYTTLTTLIVIVLLAILGVASIRTFALPIIFGLVGGFYSSVFIAAPLWGIFKGWGKKIKIANENRKFVKAKKEKTAKA